MVESLGQRFKRLRESKGLSQAELSRRSGINRSQIIAYENGSQDNPTKKTQEKLARALGITVTELMAEAPTTSQPISDVKALIAPVPGVSEDTPEILLNRLVQAFPVRVPIYYDYKAYKAQRPDACFFVASNETQRHEFFGIKVSNAVLDIILADDIAIVDARLSPKPGHLAVSTANNNVVVGRLKLDPQGALCLVNGQQVAARAHEVFVVSAIIRHLALHYYSQGIR